MTEEPNARIVLPSFLAGPIVILLLGVAWFAASIPQPLVIDPREMGPALLLVPLSAVVGFVPAVICNGIGTFLMIKVGTYFPLLRFPFLWPAVGGAAAWAFANWAGMSPEWTFAFAGSGAISALICRMRLA